MSEPLPSTLDAPYTTVVADTKPVSERCSQAADEANLRQREAPAIETLWYSFEKHRTTRR